MRIVTLDMMYPKIMPKHVEGWLFRPKKILKRNEKYFSRILAGEHGTGFSDARKRRFNRRVY